MAFQIKDFVSISASMVNWVRATTKKVTDFSIGSVVRTMLEAIAIELEELYRQMFIGLKEAIPVSVYNTFSFDLLPSQSATGPVRVVVTSSASPTLISAGTVFSLGTGVLFTASTDVTIAAGGTYADVPVVAQAAGLSGNIAANQSFAMTPSPSNLVSATNLAAFANGRDAETEDQRKLRFNAFIQSLTRGTISSLEYALENLVFVTDAAGNVTERVFTSSVVEPYLADPTNPVSLVNIYIHNGVSSASSALVAQAQKILYGYKDADGTKVPGWQAAGVHVVVYPAAELVLNVAGTLTALPGFVKADLVAQAESIVYAYLQNLPIGAAAVKSEIVRLVKSLDGVYDIVFPALADETVASAQQKIIPGTLAIS